jgi:hypothetical protein
LAAAKGVEPDYLTIAAGRGDYDFRKNLGLLQLSFITISSNK